MYKMMLNDVMMNKTIINNNDQNGKTMVTISIMMIVMDDIRITKMMVNSIVKMTKS